MPFAWDDIRSSSLDRISSVGSVTQKLQQFKPFPVRVYLHGFWVPYHYDSPEILGFIPVGFSGQTGEFFFSSICTNGEQLYDSSSSGLGDGGNGIWTKVQSGTWIDTGSMQLWPDPADIPDPSPQLLLDFRLLEADDGAVAQRILNGLGDAGRVAVLQQAGGDPTVVAKYEAALKLASEILGVYANDDVALSARIALSGPWENYGAGRFIKIRGAGGSYAILSVVPDGGHPGDEGGPNENYWVTAQRNDFTDETIKLSLKTAETGEKRLVAVMVRPRNPWTGAGVTFKNKGYTFFAQGAATRHVLLPPGDDDIEVKVMAPAGADLKVMATAVAAQGARDYEGE